MNKDTVSFSITGRLLLAFVLVPLVELTLLVQLYQETSFLFTLMVVMMTGILGVNLARHQGLSAWQAIHRQLAQGRNPSTEIMNGVMILLAGAFLMTPGLLTDCVGFGLLIPQIRRRLGKRLATWFQQRTIRQFGGTWSSSPMDVPSEDSPDQPSVRVVDPKVETIAPSRDDVA